MYFRSNKKKMPKKISSPRRRPFWKNFGQNRVDIAGACVDIHNLFNLYPISFIFVIVVLNNISKKVLLLFKKKIKNENFILSQKIFHKIFEKIEKIFDNLKKKN